MAVSVLSVLILIPDAKANVLIGIRGIDGDVHDGWQVFDYDGTYVDGSEVVVTQPAMLWSSRYLSGYTIKPGDGFKTVTALVTRDDFNNQYQFLTRWEIADANVVEVLEVGMNSFHLWYTQYQLFDAAYLQDVGGDPVWAYAVSKKPAYDREDMAYGALLDGSLVGEYAMDFGPYYTNTSSRIWKGMAYDGTTNTAYVSTTTTWGEVGLDTIRMYAVSGHHWAFEGEVSVPEEWTSYCKIAAMSVGPDYNFDGDKDLYVAVRNRTDMLPIAYRGGADFWAVLDIDPVEEEYGLSQVFASDPIETLGEVFGIAVDPNEIIPEPANCGDPGTVYLSGDINKDCRVGIDDIGRMVSDWLKCTDPAILECSQYYPD